MRYLSALIAGVGVTAGLSAALPTMPGDTGPRSTVSPRDARRLSDVQPTTRGGVLRIVGPPAETSRYVEPPGIASTRDAPWITRREYHTVNGSITVDFDNHRVVMFEFSERGK